MRTVSVRLNDQDSRRLDRIAEFWVMEPGEAMRKLIRDQTAPMILGREGRKELSRREPGDLLAD